MVNSPVHFETGNDNIVIRKIDGTIRGGRTLDVTGFKPDHINGGHIIIQKTGEDKYLPMPLKSTLDAYDDLPANHEYAGILIATIPTDKAFAAILIAGEVNYKAMPFDVTDILTALKSALTHIRFRKD